MTDTISARLDNLITPLHRWRGLGGVGKYALYTRVSLQLIPVSVALGYLVAVINAVPTMDIAPWRMVVGSGYILLLLAFAIGVFELHPDLNTRERRPVGPVFRLGLIFTLLGFAGSLALQHPAFQPVERQAAAIVSVLSLFVLCFVYVPWLRYRWIIIIGLTATAGFLMGATIPDSYWWWIMPPLMTVTVRMSIWTVNVMKEVERSRELEASLRVTEERLRFAQELHDTLGQHLAAMSLKSELALALAKRGDDRLEGELRDLQKLTRVSMSQMREVVQGYRSINLATEVEGAKSLLNDARITLRIHGAVDQVPAPQRELAAWLVREATTNVLRHSDATHVDLDLSASEVRMTNDGVTTAMGRLSGLDALRQRAQAAGVSLRVACEGGQFTVRLIPEGDAV
ncbi:Sensor histidine kinase DesK [Corynebacterium faecale]|uniref:sensor histidine kinase n=1 Tax=Corynebacterium faecale TaxID=1758466 RepID=UPI0025B4D8EF|nr:histidine kinase [Corynebacterium faecale]WJY91691.1 Sensor histidine kinase DesK [Corynebacterium faecale]